MEATLVGRTFGDFVVKSQIGAGGWGEVYLAEQTVLGRDAVIKVMARRTDVSSEAANRFLREARLASRLDHPFAAHVYAVGAESDGTLWIAMELVRGTPLNTLVKESGPLPLARFVPLFERLCEVLNAAHEQGVVHRDIKPGNVMVVSRAGRLFPKLLDLGIARLVGTPSAEGAPVPAVPLPGPQSAEATAAGVVPASVLHLEQVTLTIPPARLSELRVDKAGRQTGPDTLAGLMTRSESVELTHQGVVMGTPQYMAPEQWRDPAHVNAGADIYSLAILAYQCLTGKLPFAGKDLAALNVAHASEPLPDWGEALPAALLEVVRKGAAKLPSERFSTPLEFAAAFRAASGLGVDAAPLPQLEEGLRENIISRAPQPIAEAVTVLDGARTARQALAAVRGSAAVLGRYAGVLALAARGRVGPGAPADAATVKSLLAQLRDQGLSTQEWVALTRALVRPFASRQDAHPVPELVRFFCDPTGADIAHDVDELLAALSGDEDLDEERRLERLSLAVRKLGAVLERASFLFDYALAVQHDQAEEWMGTRRPNRLPRRVLPKPPVGEVLLVDGVGTPVLTLTPLVQCVAPSGGAAEELFFLEGPGRHGARLVALPAPFERQDEAPWTWLRQQGLLAEEGQQATREEKPPYKGLATFTSDDADNYFGREKETESFANRLRKEAFLAVVGPSGTGKSSFILAGVLPLLPPTWKPVVMRPGATPMAALKARLAAEGLPGPEVGADALVAALESERTLVLVVDQFEELVTLCPEVDTRLAFAETVLALARHPSGRLRLVLTLRDDFLIQVQQLTPFRESLSNSLQLLGTPAPRDLQRVVTEPARRVGYAFDAEDLPARMADTVKDHPGALALLSFTASQLWELRDRQLRLMRVKTYEALGGVGGALAHHAEATLGACSEAEQKLVREAFRHLVTAQGTRAVLSKKETMELLGDGPEASAALEKLVTARLLVSSETASGDDSVEIVHEALLRAWPRLVLWQREDADSARLRDSLRASARQWAERGKPSGLLWRKETLAEYRQWRARSPGRLTQLEQDFASASLGDEARARWIRRGLTLVAFVALTIGLVANYRSSQQAQHSAREAVTRLADLRVEQARLAMLDDKPFHAELYARAARTLGAGGTTLDTIERLVAQGVSGQVSATLLDGRQYVVASRDGTRLAALDASGGLVMLGLPSLQRIGAIEGAKGLPGHFAFWADARGGLFCRNDGAIWRWREGEPPREVSRTGRLATCEVSVQRRTLVGVRMDGALLFWRLTSDGDIESGPTEVPFGIQAHSLVVSPSGDVAVAYETLPEAMGPHTGAIIDLQKWSVRARVPARSGLDRSVAIHEGQQLVAVMNDDATTWLLDLKTGALRATLNTRNATARVYFSPDGKEVWAPGDDGVVLAFDHQGKEVRRFEHHASVNRLAFLPGGGFLAATTDGTVHVWVEGEAEPIHRLRGHATSITALLVVGDRQVVTVGLEGAVRYWDLNAAAMPRLGPVKQGLSMTVPSKDGTRALVGPNDQSMSLVSLPDLQVLDTLRADQACAHGESPKFDATFEGEPRGAMPGGKDVCVLNLATRKTTLLEGHQAPVLLVIFSSDGRRLASIDSNWEVRIWDASTAKTITTLTGLVRSRAIAFTPDSEQLLVGSDDGTVSTWSVATGEMVSRFRAHKAPLAWVRGTPQGTVLTGSFDHDIGHWRLDGTLLKRFQGHADSVFWVEQSADRRLLVSTGLDNPIFIWDAEKGWPIAKVPLDGPYDIWFVGDSLLSEHPETGFVRLTPLGTKPPPNLACLNPLEMSEDGAIVPRTRWDGCFAGADAPSLH